MDSQRNSRSSKKRYDSKNVDNWTSAQLRESLEEMGICVPSTMSKTVLKSLYKENVQKTVKDAPPTRQTRTRSRSPRETERTSTQGISDMAECFKTLNATVNAFTETIKTMARGSSATVTSEQTSTEWPTLAEAYTATSTGTYDTSFGLDNIRHLAAQTKNGVPASMLGNVDILSDNMKRRIVEGRYVNLASLLVPDFESVSRDETKEDLRLKKRLNIEQFRVAFGKYRRVMINKWPHRQQELEAYETDVAKMHSFYGDKFYDYHIAFANKAAEAVKLNIPIDWSKRDTELFQLILGGTRARQCVYCSSTLHESDFCDQSYRLPHQQKARYNQAAPATRSPGPSKDLDKYGRKISYHQGTEICNNYNSSSGCTKRSCPRFHGCSNCMSQQHGKLACPNVTKGKIDSTPRGKSFNSA